MWVVTFLVLLSLSLVSLGCAIYGLVAVKAETHSLYIVWTVSSTVMVYGMACAAVYAFRCKRIKEKSLANARAESLERNDEIFRIHAQNEGFAQNQASHRERTQTESTAATSTTLQTPRKDFHHSNSPHPGPLTSNPPYGPPSSLLSLPHNRSDIAIPMPAFHTASTVSITPARSRAVQIPARSRAATDAGHTAASAAASRTRANSLLQIREATARRIANANPVTPPKSATQGTFQFDS